MKNIMGFIGGAIFAVGLVLSGMTDPKKVIGFLDIFGSWDYSLAFVMGGAVITNLITFKLILNRKPLMNVKHELPAQSKIDKRLVLGATIFGIGWGVAGICPGPGIVNLVTTDFSAFLFVFALSAGMLIYKVLIRN